MKFTWEAWDFDCDGEAYVISKKECLEKEFVPEYICKHDNLHSGCMPGMVVQEGWCKYQVRTDWENCEGEPRGGYYVELGSKRPKKNRRGWFAVWIVRKGEWY